jgi:Na+/H+-dicarboxylate symporter
MRVSPALVILLGFVAGIAAGAAFPRLAPYVTPFGSIWVKALTALVVPLVVALIITAVSSLADTRAVGRIGVRVLLIFFALLVAGSALVALVTPALLTVLHVTHASAGALGVIPSPVAAAGQNAPGFWGWMETLVPSNPVAAAADGTLLPLVVFTIAFALATTRLTPESRANVVGFFRGVADAMLILVKWVLWIAPAGVFALAYALGARTGLGSARLLLTFVVLVAAACMVFLIALYLVATVIGRVPLARWTRSILRAQIVAFSTRSSLASLPAMIEAGETGLALPPAVTGFVMPLAVSTFKLGATIGIATGSLFLARLYGITVTPSQLTSIAVSSVLLSFSIPGIPAGVILVIVPVLSGLGVPAEGIGILLAIDAVPDMFRTLTNVTADMVAAVLVARSMPAQAETTEASAT